MQQVQRVDKALELCTTGSESEWKECWTCEEQVQRVDKALDLCTTGSESG